MTERALKFEENKKLTAVERAGMENHMIRRQRTMQEQIDFKVSSTSEKFVFFCCHLVVECLVIKFCLMIEVLIIKSSRNGYGYG